MTDSTGAASAPVLAAVSTWLYLREVEPRRRIDMVIDNSDLERPRVVTGLTGRPGGADRAG